MTGSPSTGARRWTPASARKNPNATVRSSKPHAVPAIVNLAEPELVAARHSKPVPRLTRGPACTEIHADLCGRTLHVRAASGSERRVKPENASRVELDPVTPVLPHSQKCIGVPSRAAPAGPEQQQGKDEAARAGAHDPPTSPTTLRFRGADAPAAWSARRNSSGLHSGSMPRSASPATRACAWDTSTSGRSLLRTAARARRSDWFPCGC